MANELYNDGEIRVIYEREKQGHTLAIGDDSYFLAQGVLHRLARTKRSELKDGLDSVCTLMIIKAKERGITAGLIGLALAQARIKVLEQEVEDLQD